jgi:KDEL-tailed cysteine endopeptidase
VRAHNTASAASHWLGMGPLADLTHDEHRARHLGYRADLRPAADLRAARDKPFSHAGVEAPRAVDWRARGAVAGVKNQAMCGSCWAFSTTGAVEGINAIVTGELRALSEQELVDCDTSRDHGCHGGLMDFAFDFIVANGGIDTEEDYPYTSTAGEEGACDPARQGRRVVTIDGHEDVPANDERALTRAVAAQPVSVAIEADLRAFQLYAGGVFDDAACGTQLNHGVLLVGYGSERNDSGHDVPFWIVKNSWGAAWGDGGYIRLRRFHRGDGAGGAGGAGGGEGLCGVAMAASFPIKKGPNPPEPPPAPPAPPPPPPSPPPEPPVDCDGTVTCPAGQTCCCMQEVFSFCITYACCPMPRATCCEDRDHCCPEDLPVCDVEGGRCTAGDEPGARWAPIASKVPATRAPRASWWGPFRPRRPAGALVAGA